MEDIPEDYSILFLDEEGNIKSWNNGSETIYGYGPGEIIGKNFRVFYSRSDRENGLPEKLLQQAKECGKSVSEGWRIKKDGTVFWSNVILTALYGDKNILTGFSKISHDLTERQKQMEFNHSNLDALINNTDDLMWSVDRDYRLITANTAFINTVAFMSGNPIGKGGNVLAIGFSEEQLAKYKGFYDRAFAGEAFKEIEYTAPPYENWSEISFYPIRHGDVVTGTACFAHDITRRKQDQQKIIHANRLYAFISQINQAIVRVNNSQQLFSDACDIAVKFGKFKVAWIALLNLENKTVSLTAQKGHNEADVPLFINTTYDQRGPTNHVVSTGDNYICNNIQQDFGLSEWKPFAQQHDILSCMVLPLRRKGEIIATFNLCSEEVDFFKEEEIAMLDEATSDLSFALDIFENNRARELAEGKLVNANRMYAFTSQLNHAIVHMTDEQMLLNEACRIAVEIGKFELACIDKVDETNRRLNLVAQNNAPPSHVQLFSTMKYTQNGAIANVLATGIPYVINDYAKESEQTFWKQYAFSRAFRSAILLPLKKAGKVQYVLCLFSKETNIFDSEEIVLLEEAAGDISFGMAVFEKDKAREEAEEKLKDSTFRLKQAEEMAHFGGWQLDFSTGMAIWSEEACRIYGLAPDDNIQSYESWVSFIHPDDLEDVMGVVKQNQTTLSGSSMYHRIIKKDGTTRYLHSMTDFEFRDGKPIGLYGVAHDITEQTSNIMQLKEQNKQLREIADIQSHEVRGPLATILGLAQLFKNKDAGLNPEEIIDGILASSQKLDTVIRDIVNKTYVAK